MSNSIETTLKNIIRPAWHVFSSQCPTMATKMIYRKHFGRFPDLNNPQRFTEKLEWLKLNKYHHNPIITQCVDKYAVREYVKSHGCEELLTGIIGCWDSVDEIPWEALPNRFAMKCTHGCGYNIICADKSKLDIDEAKRQLRKWMSKKYDSDAVELVYDDVRPRIICEEYIESLAGDYPIDYKLFCSYGETKIVYVLTGRTEHDSFIDFFTPDWKWIPVRNGVHQNAGADCVNRPDKLNEMMEYARKLAADFPFCRVDFYCENEQVRFGELTFLPTGALCNFQPQSYDEEFGGLFPIDKEMAR